MKRLLISSVAVLFLSVQVFAGSKPPAAVVKTPVNPMFQKYISMGDSLTHGFQSGAVDETRQKDTYGNRLAILMNTNYVQGLLKFPGYLVNIEDVGKGNLAWYQYPGILLGTNGKRVDNYANQSTLNNYGITGADINDILYSGGSKDGFHERVLGKSGAPALDQALAKNPTFMSIWIGNNDTLGCALWTSLDNLTEYAAFSQKYTAMVSKLTSKTSIKGLIIATIPDVASIPYLQPANSPNVPAGSLKAFWNTNPSDGDEVLDPAEITKIRQRTVEFNNLITRFAAANGWALFDSNSTFEDIKTYGHNLKNKSGQPTGRIISAAYLGGIFSLDGVHGSTTGYAAMANFFARAINRTYGTTLGYVDEFAVSETDSLYKKPYDPRGFVNSWIGQAVQWVVKLFL